MLKLRHRYDIVACFTPIERVQSHLRRPRPPLLIVTSSLCIYPYPSSNAPTILSSNSFYSMEHINNACPIYTHAHKVRPLQDRDVRHAVQVAL